MNEGDTITVKLAGNFPADSMITEIIIYNNQVIDGVDTKNLNSEVGQWTAATGNSHGLAGIFSCCADSWTQVMIEDTEANNDDNKFWYTAAGRIGDGITGPGTWHIDPELINKGKS